MFDISEKLVRWFDEKENKSTRFGRWLEALDRVQPLFMFFEDPEVLYMLKSVNTLEQRKKNFEKIMLETVHEFPLMRKMAAQIFQHLAGLGFFDEGVNVEQTPVQYRDEVFLRQQEQEYFGRF